MNSEMKLSLKLHYMYMITKMNLITEDNFFVQLVAYQIHLIENGMNASEDCNFRQGSTYWIGERRLGQQVKFADSYLKQTFSGKAEEKWCCPVNDILHHMHTDAAHYVYADVFNLFCWMND
jgi:hypothetical protein